MWSNLLVFFFQPVSSRRLAQLRVGVGVVLLLTLMGLSGLLQLQGVDIGFPAHQFGSEDVYRLSSDFLLSYPGLGRLPVPSFEWYQHRETILFFLTLAWTVGLFTCLTGPATFLVYAYLFLLSQRGFHHHTWLLFLALFVLAFAPTHRQWSVDSYLFSLSDRPVAVYPQRLLQILVTTVYLFAGLAKLNTGRFEGRVVELVLAASPSRALVDFLTTMIGIEILSWMIILAPFVIGLGLRLKVTRKRVMLLGIVMHLLLDTIVDVGTFSYLMIVLYMAFFITPWPPLTRQTMQQQQ